MAKLLPLQIQHHEMAGRLLVFLLLLLPPTVRPMAAARLSHEAAGRADETAPGCEVERPHSATEKGSVGNPETLRASQQPVQLVPEYFSLLARDCVRMKR